MQNAFEGGNATLQSNISLLQRLMNTISPAPVNSDLYIHKMHKLDKEPKSKASYWGREYVCEKQNYTPVEGTASKGRQFDKVQQLEVCILQQLLHDL